MVADDNRNYLRKFIMRSLHYLIKRMREIGTTDRHPGSGRPCTSRIADNIDAINDLMLSQKGAPRTPKTTRKIARETGISRRSVGCIIHKDIKLKCLKKCHAQQLTASNTASLIKHLISGEIVLIRPTDQPTS